MAVTKPTVIGYALGRMKERGVADIFGLAHLTGVSFPVVENVSPDPECVRADSPLAVAMLQHVLLDGA